MTAPAPELLPCPFCGSTNLKSGGDDKFVGTRCVDCEASGPNHYGKTDWNTRQAASVGAEVARSEVLIEELTAVQIAFGQATTQTEIDPERRWQAIKLVTEFLGKLRLSHGAAQKSEVRSREAIARIVDHDAWELYDNANTLTKMQKPISLWRIEPSLAKADAILTLSAAQASPVQAWQRRNIGPDGSPFSNWYLTEDKPTPENMKFDGYLSYEYRPLYAGPALPSAECK